MFAKDKKIKIMAPAKINLHLEVLGKRKDGFHELAMIMKSINLADYLEIDLNTQGKLLLSSNNKELSLNNENLIIKAALLLKNYSNNEELGANIFLQKNIPIGAGLAGGSSNAAAALVGLNKLWNLQIDLNTLHLLAMQLGSDVPFCINGGSQYCFGRGEILEGYKCDNDLALILLKDPKISISTAEVYSKYSIKYSHNYISSIEDIKKRRKDLKLKGFEQVQNFYRGFKIKNDLQKIVENENKSVIDALSILSSLKDNLCVSMSGSGPSCYGLFENYEKAKKVYDDNKELFRKYGFNSWVCNFLNQGVSFI